MRYTFIRHDRDPKLSYLFSSYEETANTGAIEWQGKQTCCLRLNTDSGRMVAKIQGWKEITEELERSDESEEIEDDTQDTIGEESAAKDSTTVVEKTIKRKTTKRKPRSKK